MRILTGQASTYFNDPALIAANRSDSTWDFQGATAAVARPRGAQTAARAISVPGTSPATMCSRKPSRRPRRRHDPGAYSLGVMSGEWDGARWRGAGHDATWSVWYADGKALGRPLVGAPGDSGAPPAALRRRWCERWRSRGAFNVRSPDAGDQFVQLVTDLIALIKDREHDELTPQQRRQAYAGVQPCGPDRRVARHEAVEWRSALFRCGFECGVVPTTTIGAHWDDRSRVGGGVDLDDHRQKRGPDAGASIRPVESERPDLSGISRGIDLRRSLLRVVRVIARESMAVLSTAGGVGGPLVRFDSAAKIYAAVGTTMGRAARRSRRAVVSH